MFRISRATGSSSCHGSPQTVGQAEAPASKRNGSRSKLRAVQEDRCYWQVLLLSRKDIFMGRVSVTSKVRSALFAGGPAQQ